MPPQVRAAAYLLIAGIPGVHAVGWVADPLGRRGFAVALVTGGSTMTRGGGETTRFIFDPATSNLLASESIAGTRGARIAGPGAGWVRPGTTTFWIAMRQATWASKAPRGATFSPG